MRKIGKILVATAAVLGSLGACGGAFGEGFGGIFGGIFGGEAQAACGYGIHADDFYAPCGYGESDDGKIKVEPGKDGAADVTIITLNNYNGGAVYLAACGSYGPDSEYFVINLIGENRITEAEGVGVGLSRVKFVGEGTLTISAMIPVGGGMLCEYCSATQGEACRINWAGIDKDVLTYVLGITTTTITPANGTVVFGHDAASDAGSGAEDGSPDNSGSSSEGSDGTLAGPTEDQTECDDFGTEDAATWILVRAGIIGGVITIVALVAFGVVKLVQLVRKRQGKVTKGTEQPVWTSLKGDEGHDESSSPEEGNKGEK